MSGHSAIAEAIHDSGARVPESWRSHLSQLKCFSEPLNVEVQLFLSFQQVPHFYGIVTKEKDQAPVRSEG